MIVLKINKPKNKKQYPNWTSDMDHLVEARFVYDPESVSGKFDGQYIYDLDSEPVFITPTDESKCYSWNLNTKWLEVVDYGGEDLSNLEELGIKISDIFKVGAIGPITLSTIGTYHDRTKD